LTLAISSPKKDKIINAMQKGGEQTLSEEDFKTIIEQAEKAYDKIFPELDKKIQGLK
jgi:exosome complex RNA-binding protein Rrp42 (RNase PH superfamily)